MTGDEKTASAGAELSRLVATEKKKRKKEKKRKERGAELGRLFGVSAFCPCWPGRETIFRIVF